MVKTNVSITLNVPVDETSEGRFNRCIAGIEIVGLDSEQPIKSQLIQAKKQIRMEFDTVAGLVEEKLEEELERVISQVKRIRRKK